MKSFKQTVTRFIILILLSVLLIPNRAVYASDNTTITIKQYVAMLNKVTGKKGKVNTSDYKNLNTKLKRVDAAVLTNRADILINGTNYNKELYAQVKNKKRISGLSQIPLGKVSAVRMVYTKGLMVGFSNGKYSQNRNFKGTSYLDKKEAANIVTRLKTKSKRKKLSPDGQLIRTTKLPKNYKKYNYILASFPNSFYDKKFTYQLGTYSKKPVELKDYACPSRLKKKPFKNVRETYDMQEVLDANLENWVKKVETNLNQRLNMNYKTVNNKWVTELRNTYYLFGDSEDQAQTKHIQSYVTKAKKNKVVIKANTVVVEPSSIYYDKFSGYMIRCYVKFKVSADTVYTTGSNKQHEMIYSRYDNTYLPGLKKNGWYEGVFDIGLGTSNMTSNGSDLAVSWDFLTIQ